MKAVYQVTFTFFFIISCVLIFVNAHKGGSSSAAAGYPYPYYYPSYPAAAPVAPVAAAYSIAFADPLAGVVAPGPAYGAASYPYYSGYPYYF